MGFKIGTSVKTERTSGTVAGEIRHPVTRNTTGVVVQPTGTSGDNDRVVTNPRSTRPVNGDAS